MKKVVVTLTNRRAYIVGASDKVYAQLNDFWSFSPPGVIFVPAHKLWIREKKRALAEGEPNRPVVGWDGKIRLLKKGSIPAGLFRATNADVSEKLGVVFDVGRDLPTVKPFVKGIGRADKEHHYQNGCVDAMLEAVQYGGGTVLAATGSGKTATAARFFSRVPYDCLFINDQIDLLHQSQEELAMWLGEPVGIVGEGHYDVQRVTVATIQTLHLHLDDAKFYQWYRKVKIVIVDELHEALAKRNFSVLDKIKPIARFGLTATLQLKQKPVRMKAYSFAGPVIYEFPLAQAQELGVVAKGYSLQMLFEAIDEESRSYDDEVIENELKLATCSTLVRYLLKKGKYVIVLADRLAHVKAINKQFRDVPHRVARGATSTEKRAIAKKRFERGAIRLIIASRIFKKAVNIKRVDAIIDMAERPNPNDPLQKFGRGVRLHKDKDWLLYIDFGTQVGKFGIYAKRRARVLRSAQLSVKKVRVSDSIEAIAALKKFLKRTQRQHDAA